MLSEGDLVASLNQSDKVRELQDKIASLRAQVSYFVIQGTYMTRVFHQNEKLAFLGIGIFLWN